MLPPAQVGPNPPLTPAALDIATASYVLAGLRFDLETVERIFRGVPSMRESVTYQAILKEGEAIGRIDAERRILLRLAERRFGPAAAGARARVEALSDSATLESLIDRVLDAQSWDDLLCGLN